MLGVGNMGRHHARIYSQLRGVELVGVADPDQTVCQAVADEFCVDYFSDHQSLLESGLDAVSVAVPSSMHKEVGLDAIDSGAAVLIEKPIAETIEDGNRLVEAALAREVLLMAGHVERFNPAVGRLKQSLREEIPISISITRVGPFPPRMSNVGILLDLAIHDIDPIRHLSGSEIDKIQSLIGQTLAGIEDTALLQFKMENGVLAHVNTNWLTPFKARVVHVATKNKFMSADLITQQVVEFTGYQADGSYTTHHLDVSREEPLRRELEHFIDCVRSKTQPLVTGEDALRALDVAIRCRNQSQFEGD